MTNRTMIMGFHTILFILFVEASFAYKSPSPETVYTTSENQQYLCRNLAVF